MADVPVDWADPCARYVALRAAYMDAIKGAARVVRFQTGNHVQEVQYSTGDTKSLRSEMDAARLECEALQGLPARPSRFAIKLGARRASPLLPGPVIGIPGDDV